MGKRLSEAEVARYERDGFLFPVDAFSGDEARRYLDRLESFEREAGQQFGKGHNFKPHLLFTWVDEIVHHPAVLDAVEDLIGPDIRLFHLSVWPKSAHDPAFVSWHQDATYFGLEPASQVTAWIALTDRHRRVGCAGHRVHAGQGRADVAAPHASGAPFRAEPDRPSPHRARH